MARPKPLPGDRDEFYLRIVQVLWSDDKDCDGLRILGSRVVTVRKSHPCSLGRAPGGDHHLVESGARAVRETAIYDDRPASCYYCLPCLDAEAAYR